MEFTAREEVRFGLRKILDVKRGIDVYIANVASARHAAARILKVLGGSRKS